MPEASKSIRQTYGLTSSVARGTRGGGYISQLQTSFKSSTVYCSEPSSIYTYVWFIQRKYLKYLKQSLVSLGDVLVSQFQTKEGGERESLVQQIYFSNGCIPSRIFFNELTDGTFAPVGSLLVPVVKEKSALLPQWPKSKWGPFPFSLVNKKKFLVCFQVKVCFDAN